MSPALKDIQDIVKVKPEAPETTPSLRDALRKAGATVDCYYFTASLRQVFKEIMDTAVNRKGQGFWIQAEYGAGKTHFLAALALLLSSEDREIWDHVHDEELRKEYQAALGKVRLFPVAFSLLGIGGVDEEDRLIKHFEKEIISALPESLRGQVSVTSDELAVSWYDNDANEAEKAGIGYHFQKAHQCTPDEFRMRTSLQKFGSEIIKAELSIDLKGSFRDRFLHIYEQITTKGGYDGMLFIVDEFRSWQDRHDGKPSYEEGCQVCETLAYYLPVEHHTNILTVVASQGDCPQKLMGGQQGDRFIVRSLLADKNRTDYGEIVAHRVRDLASSANIDIDEYYSYCRDTYKFLRQSNITKEYFRAIFPFQPRCFEVIRRVTQSFERHGLPSARAGIQMAYETLQRDSILQGKRLVVVSDFLDSEVMAKGLNARQFRTGHESFLSALDVIESSLLFSTDEKNLARRVVGTLYLWAVAMPEGARGLSLTQLAEATMTSMEGVTPDDAVLDIISQLKSDVPQVRYDKTKGARFELLEQPGGTFDRQFPAMKRKAKADQEAQGKVWRRSLFWDFRDIGGAGSQEGIEGGFLDGLCQKDVSGNIVIPTTSSAKTTQVHNVTYGGEVVVADKWDQKFGEELRDPATHFRIVYLTAQEAVDGAALDDVRIAVCCPAALSPETRENLADLIACDTFIQTYKAEDHPDASEDRERAKARRQDAITRILKNQIEEFRRGKITTSKGYGIQAEEVFKKAARSRGGREEELAGQLLDKAYDAPLFEPKEFKKQFSDADARKVFHGLFHPTNLRTTADNSARDNFAPGLGLVQKNNPAEFNPTDGGAIAWVRERLRATDDVALSEMAKDLCKPPFGLTENMVTLFVLATVRAGDPEKGYSYAVQFREGTQFTLTTGKALPGNKISAYVLPHVEWSTRLEKALLGARLQISTETGWNDVLEYARVVATALKTASSPDEEMARNDELCRELKKLSEDIDNTRDTLQKLAVYLGARVPDEVSETFQRLHAIAATDHFQEFHPVAQNNYASPTDFKGAFETFRRARQLTQQYATVQTMKSYLDSCAQLGDQAIDSQPGLILGQISFESLLNDPSKVNAITGQFQSFKDRYTQTYRRIHRDHHEALSVLHGKLEPMSRKLEGIARLNELELGAPLGGDLAGAYRALLDATEPCASKDDAKVREHPVCQVCCFDGSKVCPETEVAELVKRVERVGKDLSNRVAQGAVRKVLSESTDESIKTLLDVIVASQVERLPDVLIPEVIERIKKLLYDANLEHRDLQVRDLFADFGAVEEHEIDTVVDEIRTRLRAAFSKAKADTDGKKRIRFFLR